MKGDNDVLDKSNYNDYIEIQRQAFLTSDLLL